MMDLELRVRVLGAAELTVSGRPLAELASAKGAALLYYLAVTGTAQPRSTLAGLLWSDLPEPTARANLRLVLTKLRRVLPQHLQATRQSVGLAGPVRVDTAEVAQASGSDVDPQVLLAAARLCRGEFLAGFGVPGAPVFDEWATTRRAALRAEMLALLERAVRWARAEDDTATGVEMCRRMLALEPLQEEAHRALMWFLARGRQRSAALAQYETCRYLLREELGITPSAATVALRDDIAAAGGFTELGAPPAAPPPPGLPRPLSGLIGRRDELTRLHRLLDDPACRLVTLIGPGGVGKTRLAVEIAAVRDGVVFVSYAGAAPAGPEETADRVVADLNRALGVSTAVPRDPLELLGDHLAGREVLLVLDNLEQLPGAAGVLATLLSRAPRTKFLVTSRRRLGLAVEWLVELPGLPYPPPEADAQAAGYESVQLFEERARALRPGPPTAADTAGAARICRLVAGLPLAIELAARWVRSAGPAAIAERLTDGLELLATTAPHVEDRHRSLRAVLDWSYQLLTDEEERALSRLSVLRRGFDLAAASAVAGADLPLLAGLVDQSLVTLGDDGRYDMHELLRQYAAGRLAADPGDEARTRRRHAEHYASLLGPGSGSGYEREGFDGEAENLRAATEWFIRHGDPDALDGHLSRVWALYRRAGWFREAQAFFGAALELRVGTRLQRARWHRLLGEAHQQVGAAQAARHHLEQALRTLGRRVPVSATGRMWSLAEQSGRRALRRLGLEGPPRPDEAREKALAGFAISEVYWLLEDPALLPTALSSLNDAEQAGDLDLVVRTQAGLGMIAGTAGWHRIARRHLRAATAAVDRAGDPLTVCWLAILGGIYWTGVGDWAAIDTGEARVRRLCGRIPMHRWADEVVLVAAAAHYLTARYPEASAGAAAGLVSGRERRDPVVQFWGLIIQIETALRIAPEDPSLAGWGDEARGLLPKVARVDAARLHVAEARTHLAAGRPEQAWRAIRAAEHLVGRKRSFEQYALEAQAGVAEVCLALREQGTPPAEEVRASAAAAVRRLRRYARNVPMARPRALICAGWSARLDGRPGRARRAWQRAAAEAERLGMPYELARARHELDCHTEGGVC